MSPSTIRFLIDTGKTSEEIEDILIKDSILRREVQSYNAQLANLKEKYEQSVKEIKSKISELRLKCPHHETSFNQDPSGNNDSYYNCTLCGKEARNINELRRCP